MHNSLVNTSDQNIMILDEMIGDCSIPSRDWQAIIDIYESENKKFPIPAMTCSYIIQRIKDGLVPKMVFREYGISYQSFLNQFNKIKESVSDLLVSPQITDGDWEYIDKCRLNPLFILGQDIERAGAFHFNTSLMELKELSAKNPQALKDYMKLVHPEEFNEREKETGLEVIIKLAPGLIDSI